MKDVLTAQCPLCKALPGEWCVSYINHEAKVKELHNKRFEAYECLTQPTQNPSKSRLTELPPKSSAVELPSSAQKSSSPEPTSTSMTAAVEDLGRKIRRKKSESF